MKILPSPHLKVVWYNNSRVAFGRRRSEADDVSASINATDWKHLGLNLLLQVSSTSPDCATFLSATIFTLRVAAFDWRVRKGHGGVRAVALPWKPPLTCAPVVCVFQLGDPGGLHHHTPAACCQGEAVYREHRGAGAGGQRAGQGNVSLSLSFVLQKLRGESHRDALRARSACSLCGRDAIKRR